MSKIAAVIGIVLLMNIAMFIFSFSGADADACEPNCDLSDFNTESSNGTAANSTMWSFFSDPTEVSGGGFIDRLFGSTGGILALLLTGGAIVIGAVWITKDINVAYITIAIYFSTFVIATWVRLWIMLNDSAFVFGGRSGGVVVTILIGIGLMVHLMALIDWGRGR